MITQSVSAGRYAEPAGRRPEEDADLGNDPGELDLVVEDAAGVEAAGEDLDLLRDAPPRRVDEVEQRAPASRWARSWMRTIFCTVFSPQEPAFTV